MRRIMRMSPPKSCSFYKGALMPVLRPALTANCCWSIPVLVLRKTMIGKVLDKPVGERLYGSLALALMALERGTHIIRVHDVATTMDAVKIFRAVTEQQ